MLKPTITVEIREQDGNPGLLCLKVYAVSACGEFSMESEGQYDIDPYGLGSVLRAVQIAVADLRDVAAATETEIS